MNGPTSPVGEERHAVRGEAWAALLCATFAATGCSSGRLIGPFNEPPVADAKVLKMGMPVEQMRDGSIAELVFPYEGMPVAITLDGSASYDPDGRIVSYRWLSATRMPDASLPLPWLPDAGSPMPFLRMPPAEGALDDEVSPTIMVGAGVWAFSLWVLDDQGVWSNPDTIRFIVGEPSAPPRDGGTSDAAVPSDAGAPADAGLAEDAAPAADAAHASDAAAAAD